MSIALFLAVIMLEIFAARMADDGERDAKRQKTVDHSADAPSGDNSQTC